MKKVLCYSIHSSIEPPSPILILHFFDYLVLIFLDLHKRKPFSPRSSILPFHPLPRPELDLSRS